MNSSSSPFGHLSGAATLPRRRRILGEFKMRNPAGAKTFESQLARFKLAEGKLAEALALSRYPTNENGLEAQFSAAFFAKDYPAALRNHHRSAARLVEQTFSLGWRIAVQKRRFFSRAENEKRLNASNKNLGSP